MEGEGSPPRARRRLVFDAPTPQERMAALERRLSRSEALIERLVLENRVLRAMPTEMEAACQALRQEFVECLYQHTEDDHAHQGPHRQLTPESQQRGMMTLLAQQVSDEEHAEMDIRDDDESTRKRARDSDVIAHTLLTLPHALNTMPLSSLQDDHTEISAIAKWWHRCGYTCAELIPLQNMFDGLSPHAGAQRYWFRILRDSPEDTPEVHTHHRPDSSKWCVFCLSDNTPVGLAIKSSAFTEFHGRIDALCAQRLQAMKRVAAQIRKLAEHIQNSEVWDELNIERFYESDVTDIRKAIQDVIHPDVL